MTTKEMIYNCESKVKNITKSENISIDTADWIIFLNEAQEQVFRENVPLNQTEYSHFDLLPATRSNLAGLIKDKEYFPADSKSYTGTKYNGISYSFEYPADLKYVDMSEAILINASNTTYIAKVKDVEPRYTLQNGKNPFKKPDTTVVWRLDYGTGNRRYSEIMIPTGFDLERFVLRYITKLPVLSMECNTVLNNLDIDIVNKAVEICLQSHQNNLYLKQLKQDN